MRAEKERNRARRKAWRKRQRQDEWLQFKKRFNKFIANPFAKRELTAHQLERRRIRQIIRRERKLD